MAFEAFVEKTVNAAYRLRLSQCVAAGACILVGIAAAGQRVNAKAPPPPKLEDLTDVKFVEEIPEEKEPEKPKEPEPPAAAPVLVPESVKVSSEPPPPPPPVPTEIPKDKLDEADPSKDKGIAGGSHSGDPGGAAGGTGTATAAIATTPPPPPPPPTATTPPPPPPPPKATLVSETDVPPKLTGYVKPPYPEAARAAGTTGAVTVRITIDENGDVTDVKIVKSDPTFDAVVLETVKKWKFTPAKHEDGTAFKTTIVRKIPFTIKTQ
ncbi:MAG: energy transducer TonB [Myxococcales bacterium]|nr:energy transducer TonB [Myxococcales bacterium]